MINKQVEGLSVFRWLKTKSKRHLNPNFAKKYNFSAKCMQEPTSENSIQSKSLNVVSHPYILKPWIKLHSFSSYKSMCMFQDEIQTGADLDYLEHKENKKEMYQDVVIIEDNNQPEPEAEDKND